jgi:hypothetical protein
MCPHFSVFNGLGKFFHIFEEKIRDFRGSLFPLELESNSRIMEKLLLFQSLTATNKIWHQKCCMLSHQSSRGLMEKTEVADYGSL